LRFPRRIDIPTQPFMTSPEPLLERERGRSTSVAANALLALLLLFLTAIWGVTFPVVKDAVEGYGVLWFLAIRFGIATAVLAAFAWRRCDRRTLLVGASIGMTLAAGYTLQTFGLRHTTATHCGLITGLFVFFAPVANLCCFGIRTSPLLWTASLASLVGLALLTASGDASFSQGDLLTLGAAMSYGLHIALLGRYAKGRDPLTLALGQVAASAVLFLGGAIATEPFACPDRRVVGALLLTSLLATAASFPIQAYVQKRLPPVRTAIVLTMEPIFAAAAGYMLAGDRLAAVQWMGAAVMVGAALAAEIASALRDPPA
jgi:drug/metabolite transporter (DMT)-like permease